MCFVGALTLNVKKVTCNDHLNLQLPSALLRFPVSFSSFFSVWHAALLFWLTVTGALTA